MNDRIRKLVVTLKRRTHFIPLAMLAICCGIYTFQLTAHSDASMYVGSQTIALYVFIITLASILVLFSYMNAYSKRGKHNIMMLVIAYALAAVQVVMDVVYLNIMNYETVLRDNPVPVTPAILKSTNWTKAHLIAMGITLVAMLALPLYKKILMGIDTSINDDEEASGMDDEKLAWEDE